MNSALIIAIMRARESLRFCQLILSRLIRRDVPRSLHARLAREAEQQGVSLNQWTANKLA